MATQTANRPVDRFGKQDAVFNSEGSGGILAGVKLFQGQGIGWTPAGWLAPIGTNGVIKFAGVCDKLYDNTAGGNGALQAVYRVGVFPFSVGAGVDALTQANVEQFVFFIDDHTVGATDGLGTRLPAGLFLGLDASGLALVQGQPACGLADYFSQTWQKTAADGAAATATAEFPFIVAPFTGKVAGLRVAVGGAGLVANDANFATVILSKRTAGGAAVTVASFTTQTVANFPLVATGSWTAWTPAYGPQAAVVAGFNQGDELTLQITKTGTGVVVPIMTLEVDLLAA